MFGIRKRKVILVFLAVIVIFITITINFMYILTKFQQSEVIQTHLRREDKIRIIQLNLPDVYYRKQPENDLVGRYFIKYLNSGHRVNNLKELWSVANSWVSKTHIYKIRPQLGNILYALKNTKIIKTNLDNRGSQLKFLLTLEVSLCRTYHITVPIFISIYFIGQSRSCI